MEKVIKAINEEFDKSIESWKYLIEDDNLYLIGRLEECQNAKVTVNRVFEQHGTGRWMQDEPATVYCSKCTYRVWCYNNTPFCPNCGCKMIKEN